MSSDFDIHDLRAQEAAESELDEAGRQQQQIDDDDFIWLMQDKRGRRIVWRQWLEPTGVFRNPFTGEALATSFRCGEQNIGQKLMVRLHTLCPDKYTLMQKENIKHAKRRT